MKVNFISYNGRGTLPEKLLVLMDLLTTWFNIQNNMNSTKKPGVIIDKNAICSKKILSQSNRKYVRHEKTCKK